MGSSCCNIFVRIEHRASPLCPFGRLPSPKIEGNECGADDPTAKSPSPAARQEAFPILHQRYLRGGGGGGSRSVHFVWEISRFKSATKCTTQKKKKEPEIGRNASNKATGHRTTPHTAVRRAPSGHTTIHKGTMRCEHCSNHDKGTQERQQTGGGATQTHRTREPHQEGQGRAHQTRRRGTAR